jgi:hypothetical protein
MSNQSDSKNARLDKEFANQVKEIMRIRFSKGFIKFNNMRELGFAEGTRLILRTPSWPKVVEELKTMPKKENVNKK